MKAVEAIAEEAMAVLGSGRQIAPFSERHAGLELKMAYEITAAVCRKRLQRGEQPIGRKIGFTNRTIWAEYNVHAPIWGYIFDTTVFDLNQTGKGFPLTSYAEPRIEPEIMFGLSASPLPGMKEKALLDCIEWVAHGFEIVQSIFPAWKFHAPDTVAAYGLHGALLTGPKHGDCRDERLLSAFEIDLFRDGCHMDRGRAENVLGGPLLALRHLVELLARDPVNPPLGAGEIVTTGTLTRAFPVQSGERWTTELTGIPLEGASLQFI